MVLRIYAEDIDTCDVILEEKFHLQQLLNIIEKMRRSSVKKSSMFKVQADKNIFRKYLENIETCATVRSYPHLLDVIKKSSQTVYNYCYDFSQETPFSRGMNYGCKSFGLSYPSTNIIVIKQWIPNAKQVYLLGGFNNFNQNSHPMLLEAEEKDIFTIELDISKEHINHQDRILLKIIDNEGKIHKMPPPSCKIRSKDYGYICIDIGLPVMKHHKKHDIIMAYTIDLQKVPLEQTLHFIKQYESLLKNFNTIILKGLFNNEEVLDKGTISLEQMKHLRDIIDKIKNEMSLRIIIQWSFEPGKLKYGLSNPVEKELFKNQNGLWQYDLKKPQVTAFYLANLSYFLSTFQVDGFHFKYIDSFCKDEYGQTVVKCMNIMNHRLHENGFTLASCKKEVPGLNEPILEGGLGFTFTYNYSENFLQSVNQTQLKEKFDKILRSSNCVAINLDQLTPQHELNFLFAVLVSGKGIFCKGSLNNKEYLLSKLFTLRKQPELFNESTVITKVSDSTLLAQRGSTKILFNFAEAPVEEKITTHLELISSFSRREPVVQANSIKLDARCCTIFEQKYDD